MPLRMTDDIQRTWRGRPRLRAVTPLVVAFAAVVVFATACGDSKSPQTTPTPRPIPSPVTFPQEPAGNYKLGDPTLYGGNVFGVGDRFEPRAGSEVDTGRLGGSIYQIEVPDDWNGRLVLSARASRVSDDPNLLLKEFPLRSYLIRNGYAWGQTSGSSNADGPLPEELAALWDHFVQHHGRPRWTYLTGEGYGGVIVRMAAARYAERFDGALTVCSTGASSSPRGDMLVAGAFAAGVTQSEFDETEIRQLIDRRIRPALADPAARSRFEAILVELSGGRRPFVIESLRDTEDYLWRNVAFIIGLGFIDNTATVYRLRGAAGVSDDDFNASVVRIARGNPELYRRFNPGADAYYDLKVPLLTINYTGDTLQPISIDQDLRRRMTAAGSGDMLSQRTVRGFQCTLQDGEWDRGLADLAAWVEHGAKPEGEDLLADDLTDIGRAFTGVAPVDSPEADAVPGADQRLSMSGTLTFDGQPLVNAEVWVYVLKDGILRPCSYWSWYTLSFLAGRYEHEVAADTETAGCGADGARLYLVMYSDAHQQQFIAETALDWPSMVRTVTFDAHFSSEHPLGAGVGTNVRDFLGQKFWGVVLDAAGSPMPPGTLVEAYVGDTRCGAFAVPPTQMVRLGPTEEASVYALRVSGPELKPGCTRGAPISFRINGKPTAQTGTNTLEFFAQELDLQVEE